MKIRLEVDVAHAIKMGLIRIVCEKPLEDGQPCGDIVDEMGPHGNTFRCWHRGGMEPSDEDGDYGWASLPEHITVWEGDTRD